MASVGYQGIYCILREKIERGEFPPSAALPSESLLCAEFQASRPTVRRALNMLINESLIIRQPGVGSFVAPQKAKAVQPVIGIDLGGRNQSPFYLKLILEGLRESCLRHHAQLRILEPEECAKISSDEIAGLISATAREYDFPALREQARRGIPVVLINRVADGYPELSCVSVDYIADSSWIVGQAIDNGFKRVALISADVPGGQVYAFRSTGWRQAYTSRGLEVPEELVLDQLLLINDLEALSEFLLSKRPDAVFVTTGEFMNQLLLAIMKSGIRIPEQLRIICFDDLSDYGNWNSMPVCFVRMPLQKMGDIAVRHILGYPLRPRSIREVLPSSFIFTSAGSMF